LASEPRPLDPTCHLGGLAAACEPGSATTLEQAASIGVLTATELQRAVTQLTDRQLALQRGFFGQGTAVGERLSVSLLIHDWSHARPLPHVPQAWFRGLPGLGDQHDVAQLRDMLKWPSPGTNPAAKSYAPTPKSYATSRTSFLLESSKAVELDVVELDEVAAAVELNDTSRARQSTQSPVAREAITIICPASCVSRTRPLGHPRAPRSRTKLIPTKRTSMRASLEHPSGASVTPPVTLFSTPQQRYTMSGPGFRRGRPQQRHGHTRQ
jgi:hypothetical protein